jgi:serine protease Do
MRLFRHSMFGLVRLVLVPALMWQPLIAHAQTAAPEPTPVQLMMNAMANANASVVGLRVAVAEGARSSETLGQRRAGSGVLIGENGLVLTIGYLLLEAEQIEIVTQDNKMVPARAVAYDLATGFGLVRPLLPLPKDMAEHIVALGSTQELKPGEPLMAVTGPQPNDDGDIAMTRLVSKRAFSGTWEYHIETALFTSPPIMVNGGNHSGAPLFNQKGELIGIGSLFVSDASGANQKQPGNMFVPVDLLRPILAEMQQSGMSQKSRRPWLGVTSSDQGGRIQVLRVTKDSPAQLAGLNAGDVVMAVDGAPVVTLEAFYKKVWDRSSPDAEITLTVRQEGEVKSIVLKAEDRMLTLKKPASI